MNLFNGPFLHFAGWDWDMCIERKSGKKERKGPGWGCMVVRWHDFEVNPDEFQVCLHSSIHPLAYLDSTIKTSDASTNLPLETLRVERRSPTSGTRCICKYKQPIALCIRAWPLREVIGRIGSQRKPVEDAFYRRRNGEEITSARNHIVRHCPGF